MKITSFQGLALACLMAAGPFVADSAFAKTSATMTTCSANYKADKAAGTVPAGQTWSQYLSTCSAGLKASGTVAAAPAATATPAVVAAPAVAAPAAVAKNVKVAATTQATAGKPTPTAGQQAMYDRERQCGAMWKTDKAAGTVPAGQTWPQFWSQCNTKLKG